MDSREREDRAEALIRFERQTAIPMLILSLAIIPLIVIPLIWDVPSTVAATLLALDWFIWAAFALEYGVRLYLAPKKWPFVRSNKIDLVVVILPFLRPLRVLRSARALRVGRAVRAAVLLGRAIDAGRDVLTRHKLHYALVVTGGVVIGAAFVVEAFERGAQGANITSIPDAIWWAITTVTTVGYGDRYPTTAGGRGVAAALMVFGIALFGFLAGTLASFFLERRDEAEIDPKLEAITKRLAAIEQLLSRSPDPE
jgi:voltage-gated potassium channel